MRQPSGTLLASLVLRSTVSALSLSEWQPAASGLTASCETVYAQTIPSCEQSDFGPGATCSAACIEGLISINNQVYQQCAGEVQNDQFLLGVFLAGQGISALCPNVVVTTATNEPPVAASSIPALPSSSSASAPKPTHTGMVYDTAAAPTMSRSSIPFPRTSHTSQPTTTVTHRSTTHKTIQKTHLIYDTSSTSVSSATPTSTAGSSCDTNGSPFGSDGGSCSGAAHVSLSLWLGLATLVLASWMVT